MKGQNKGLIVLLFLVALSLGTYIVYSQVGTKDVKDDKKDVVDGKTEDNDKEELDKIGEYLFEKEEKYELYALGSGNYEGKTNLTQEQVFAFYYYLMDNGNLDVTKDKIDNYVKDLYNIELSEYPEIKLGQDTAALYSYDKNKNEYVSSGFGHGVFEINPIFSKLAKVEKNDNYYTITVTRVYKPVQGTDFVAGTPEQEYYADKSYTTKIEKLHAFVNIYDANGELIKSEIAKAQEYYEQNYDEFKNLKPQYKYTFKKENNDYYLVSVEIIK
ncbi:MAG: hypothetical protein IJR82_05115 [Bacilli bacterium]|nr:hypothetical protein [Bacilli bacterium]